MDRRHRNGRNRIMSRVRNLITAAALAVAIGCSTAPTAAPKPASGGAKSSEAPTMMSSVKPEEIEVARPGGKISADLKVQLVEVAGGFIDPIHVTSARDGSGRLFVCE